MKSVVFFIAGAALASGWWLYALGIIPLPVDCSDELAFEGFESLMVLITLSFSFANLVALIWSLRVIGKAIKKSWD